MTTQTKLLILPPELIKCSKAVIPRIQLTKIVNEEQVQPTETHKSDEHESSQ